MPAVAIVAVMAAASAGAAAAAAGLSLVAIVGIAAAAGAVAGLMSYSAMQAQTPSFKSPDSGSTLGTTTDTKTVLPVVYGKQRLGGIVTWKNLARNDNTKLVQIFAISEGEIDNVNQLYLDNKRIFKTNEPNLKNGVVNNSHIKDEYRDILEVEFSIGNKEGYVSQLAKKYLTKEEWNDQFKGRNVAYGVIVLHKKQNALTDGVDILQPNSQIVAEVNGLLIKDLVTGERISSNNGPSQALDYLVNQRYGLGVDPAKVDIDSFVKAAKYAYNNNLMSNGTTDPNASFKENLTQITAAFNGYITEQFGLAMCVVDQPDAVKFVFNEDNIQAGQVALKTGESSEYYNTLNVSYQEPANDYSDQVLRYPSEVAQDATIAKDKRIIAKDINYRFVKDKKQIDVLASLERNKSRLTQTLSFTTADAYTLQVWDVIKVDYEELFLKNSLWRVSKIERNLEKGLAGMLNITCIEYDSRIYTDLDYAKDPNNNGSNIPDETTVIAPTNLTVKATAETVYGRNVMVAWEAEDDYNRYGFNVQYKVSGSSDWINVGSTSNKWYNITQLDSTYSYDFRVCSYGLISHSVWIELINQKPEITYPLPAVKQLALTNFVEDSTTTTDTEFRFAWEDQSQLDVNINGQNQKFVDLFDYYQVTIYGKKNTVFKTKAHDFNYNFSMNANAGLSRQITIGVVSVGFGNMKSTETKLTVKNNQAPAIKGFTASGTFGTVFTSWNDETPVDYAGTSIQIATDQNMTQNVKYVSSSSLFLQNFELEDGDYFVRAGWYDVFGTDNIIWSETTFISMKSQVDWNDQDVAQLEDLLELDKKVQGSIDESYKLSKEYADKTVAQSQTDTLKKADQNTKAQIETLHTTVTNERDGAISQSINKVEADYNNKFTQTNAKITQVEKTQANDRAATAESIKQVRAETDNKVASVSQQSKAEIDKLTGTINSKWAVQANANGVVAGISMLATNDPNGTKSSAIIFNADKIAITNNGQPTGAVPPFVVANNKVWLQTAMIQNASIGNAQIVNASINNAKIADASINDAKIINASITGAKIVNGSIDNAKIGNYIQSANWNGSTQGWNIDKNGKATFNNVTIRGHVEASSGTFKGRIEAQDGFFNGTVQANRIEGDITKTYSLNANSAITIPAANMNRQVSIPTLSVWSEERTSATIELYVDGVSVKNLGTSGGGLYVDSWTGNLPAGKTMRVEYRARSKAATGGDPNSYIHTLVVLAFRQ